MSDLNFDEIVAGRPPPEKGRIVLEYLHELTIEARDVDEPRKLKGLMEVMHTLAGTLLRAVQDDDYLVGPTVEDKGRIYEVTENLRRAWKRLVRRKGY